MQQNPAMFMDPAFFNGPNGMPPPYMMQPGFMPPFGGGGLPGASMGGPEMWGMGQTLPGLPPMGPGFPTPRIGFGDSSGGAGRGRGRGRGNSWQQDNNSNPSPTSPGGRGRGFVAPAAVTSPLPSQGSRPEEPVVKTSSTNETTERKYSSSQDRFDDPFDDMSQVPRGPRGARR